MTYTMNKLHIKFLGVLMVLTISVSVLHFSQGQRATNVVARVELTEFNDPKKINISQDKTIVFEEKYNQRDIKDMFVSELGITILEILVVAAFTMMYIDANKARIRVKELTKV